jgi:subtilisin-like proprotein convertase family protein
MINTNLKLLFKSNFFLLTLISLISGCKGSKFESASLAGGPNDPLTKYAWHILNTGQNIFATTPAVSGNDLNLIKTWSNKIYGKNIWIQISDDGLEDTHEDLQANFSYFNTSKNYTLASPFTATTSRPIASTDNHGTCVAGLAAAVGGNKFGSSGIAPRARLSIANFLSDSVTQTTAKYLDQATGDFDISNMSWGTTQNTLTALDSTYNAQIKSLISTKRSGLGTIFVKAAGNNYAVLCNGSSTVYCIGNSNFDGDNVMPYMIVVGALNSTGTSSSYSSPGSDLWISTFGGEFGYDSPAMITTDRSGCTLGYATSVDSVAFEKGTSQENSNCNYTSTFNGTSAASPIVAGTVALMLEANPNLNWREVKYILAKTATVSNYETGTLFHPISTMPASYVWEQKWITNAAGYKFQNWYGFGRINIDAAVAMAKDMISTPFDLGTYTETNWSQTNTGLSLPIPDFSATGVTNAIVVTTDLTVEAVQIRVAATHSDISELALELTSPAGTKSILVNGRNSLTGIANYTNETFISNAFYQESTVGTWTLKVVDTKSGVTGTLTSFGINFIGGSH